METTAIAGDKVKRLHAALAAAGDTLHSALSEIQHSRTYADALPSADHQPRATAEVVSVGTRMTLSDQQKRIIERVINVFETGSVEGKYGAISLYYDGPGGVQQITYGRSQTTEYGNLRELVVMYTGAGGAYSSDFLPYIDMIGRTALVNNASFKSLLRAAGIDPVMRSTQDEFFEKRYFQPAARWATGHSFTQPLSMLVIYDSFIHSGGILQFLRERFPERTPDRGGDERTWISEYTSTRHDWLSNHSNPVIRASNYRTEDMLREIGRDNWDLAARPFYANGVPVNDVHTVGSRTARPEILVSPEGEWSELERPNRFAQSLSVGNTSLSSLAEHILNNTRIKLATRHVSGVADRANAHQNIVDTAAGERAHRSEYGTAPGGKVWLDAKMLQGLIALAEDYSFEVSELCGGEHSLSSRHYRGVTADVNIINGSHINASHPDQAEFRIRCSELGATQVLGPGDAGHSTHIHAAWPIPGQ